MIRNLLASLVLVGLTVPALSQPIEETPHKDWIVRCGTALGASERRCEMYQVVFADADQTQRALHAVVGYPKDSTDLGMILILPLGISLPAGTFVQVDQADPIQVPVERCERDGCRIELLLTAGFLDSLKSGNQMSIIAHDRQRRSFNIPLSLQGFTSAFEAL